MAPVSNTRTYNARLVALLDAIRPVLQAQITQSNAFYFKYQKSGNWKKVNALGDRLRVPLMYEFAPVGTFGPNGVSTVDITPTDGQTAAFFDWCRLASSITIGDFERAQNKGTALDLLKSKTEQAMQGLQDRFGRWLLQGQAANDTTSVTTAWTSPTNSSKFVEPIPSMIQYNPTTSRTLGDINQSTETYWQNQSVDGNSYSSNFAALLKGLDHLINLCSKSAGPGPDLFVTDLMGYEVIAAALRALLRFVDYEEVGFPFKAIRLNGAPLVFDQWVVDPYTPSTTVGSDLSALYAVNTKFIGMTVYSGADFTPGEFVRAPNATGESAIIQWYGAHWISRRDKHGVIVRLKNSLTS